ncbi:hypothetical protein [Terasakiella sp.]|uniref:hypothetical protein n=1 Tax=Terasakiella sp. TaxID=2034861 RepID=UPI003AA8E65B
MFTLRRMFKSTAPMLWVVATAMVFANTAHAGVFDKLGSLFGGSGSDVFEVTIRAKAALDVAEAKSNGDLLNYKFRCDLRKSKQRICTYKNMLRVRGKFSPRSESTFYDFVIAGYEREPDLHDVYFVMPKDWARTYNFSLTKNKPYTFRYDDLPIEKTKAISATFEQKGITLVDLDISIREIDPDD